ncbi:tetratricopeptide repeat protein [Streptomyces griseoflavus]|uniref:tetratricopeptide repeat protein n=1 Tax=Streptomyces griseoflavus TaxID=35619 RepID=UPI00340831C4
MNAKPMPSSASGSRSATASNNPGVISTGNGARIEQRTLVLPPGAIDPALDGAAIAKLNNLPAYDSAVFKGRDEELRALAAVPSTGTGVVAQSVRGLGGMGKSTLVLHHARAFLAAGGGPVWWIDAETEAGIVAGLAGLATALNPVHAALPLEEGAEWALLWLQGRSDWLVVFDNAEDPADLASYLGRLTTGQVVITTRRDLPWHNYAAPLCLDTLTPDAAMAVLEGITGRTRADDTAFEELVEELGCLPLALQQAGAYLAQTRTSASNYLTELRQDPVGILATTPPGDAQQRTVLQVWSVTLKAVEVADPHAVRLLRILAHMAPDPLLRSVLDTALPTRRAVDHALGVLAAYSMITLTDSTVTTHRLVQSVIRITTPLSPAAPTRRQRLVHRLLRRPLVAPSAPLTTALALLLDATPPGSPAEVKRWPIWHSLLPHFQAVMAYHSDDSRDIGLATALGETAVYLRSRGQAPLTLSLEERALAIAEAELGPNHPATALRLGNLAATLSELGRHSEALPLAERALAITETALGPDHPATAVRLNNLAATLSDLGRHSEALPLAKRALAITETALGPDHPTTALRLDNLAQTLSELGRHSEALPLAERALAITETALGPDHPDTAVRLGNLAQTLSESGRHSEALPLAKRALAITETALGPDHPDTAVRLGNLAGTLSELGRHSEALPLAKRALAITETALGPDHPATAVRLGNLAATLSDLGRHSEALPLKERALAITETALGPDHPDTALRLDNLAATLSDLGRHSEALPLKERALAITETALGPNHPDTALRLGNFAGTLSDLGRHNEALPLAKRALAITETALGPDHPTTALRLGNFAGTLSDLGRHNEALPLAKRALAITETALGPDHPDTAVRLGNIAATLSKLARHEEALPLRKRALDITETALGPHHPTTAVRLGNIAATLSKLARHEEALPLAEQALAITEATLGPDHPDTALRLNNLADIHRQLGQGCNGEEP